MKILKPIIYGFIAGLIVFGILIVAGNILKIK